MEIWTANIDGSGLTQLTCNSVADSAPNWSPDGSQIVFQSLQNSGTDYEIYVMPVQTCGTGTMLTDNSATDTAPAFSPDGSHIAFSSNRISNPEIWVMQSNGGSPTRLTTRTGSDLTPAWSPDGSRIAWTAGYSTGENHVWAMDADGQHQVDLTLVTATAVKDLAPAWSPDGTTIVFASTPAQSPNTDLYTMVADGTGVIRLTNATNNDTTPDW